MFTDNLTMNAAGIYFFMKTDQIAEPRTVEHCAGTDDPSAVETADLKSGISQDIYRIRSNQQNGMLIVFRNLLDDIFKNRDVLSQKINPGLTRLLGRRRRLR